MNFVILDLEWNGSFSKKSKKYFNEIIEFGAVKLDSRLNIVETFSMLITPQVGKKLNKRILQLTQITNEELVSANNTFTHVVSKFSKFLEDSVLLTWGTTDIHTLMENFEYYEKSNKIPFMKRYCDLQVYCEKSLDMYDKAKQMGLSTCAEHLGIDSAELTLHRALTDAELSALCFKRLYDAEEFQKYIELCDEEFYRKVTFRTAYLTDITNPLIDRSQMYFDCPDCGKRATKKSGWSIKNRQFRANFHCKECSKDFSGRITYRLKYEGVTITKKAVPIVKEEQQEENAEN